VERGALRDIVTMHKHRSCRAGDLVDYFHDVDMIDSTRRSEGVRGSRGCRIRCRISSATSPRILRAVADDNNELAANSAAGSLANAFFAPTGTRDEMRYHGGGILGAE